jgi:hypothetical protein
MSDKKAVHHSEEGTVRTTKCASEGLVISRRNGRCHRKLKIPPFEGLGVNRETERLVIKVLNTKTYAPKWHQNISAIS